MCSNFCFLYRFNGIKFDSTITQQGKVYQQVSELFSLVHLSLLQLRLDFLDVRLVFSRWQAIRLPKNPRQPAGNLLPAQEQLVGHFWLLAMDQELV